MQLQLVMFGSIKTIGCTTTGLVVPAYYELNYIMIGNVLHTLEVTIAGRGRGWCRSAKHPTAKDRHIRLTQMRIGPFEVGIDRQTKVLTR